MDIYEIVNIRLNEKYDAQEPLKIRSRGNYRKGEEGYPSIIPVDIIGGGLSGFLKLIFSWRCVAAIA